MMGVSCTIVCGITIGRYVCIGAGAVVTKEVPDYALVVGAKARITSWVCECDLELRLTNEEATYSYGGHFLKTGRGIAKLGDQRALEKTGVGAQRHEIVATPRTSPV